MKSLVLFATPLIFFSVSASPQTSGSLGGTVQDSTGAVIPAASLTLKRNTFTRTAHSREDGSYSFGGVPDGTYSITVEMAGFARYTRTSLLVRQGKAVILNIIMKVAETEQEVTVSSDDQQLSVDADQNASARVIKGKDLDALDDNPDALLSELSALAGPAAGANGGQLYIDGFSGGQLPQKSTIKEIRINQNPLSAEFDRLGYGRIEVFTKAGADKTSAHLGASYLNSALDTANPLAEAQPSYQFYWLRGDITGPIRKNWSYLFTAFEFRRQNQAIIRAVDPGATSDTLATAFPTPSSLLNLNFRTDAQLGSRNSITVSDLVYRSAQSGNGVGALALPEQAESSVDWENTLNIKEVFTITPHLVNETSARWWRVHQTSNPTSLRPSVTVQGAFSTGGASEGVSNDHQDRIEFQNYSTASLGNHTLRFGTRLRSYHEASYATAGVNGSYLFSSLSDYVAGKPYQYTGTIIETPAVRTLLFDGAVFVQDEWRAYPTLNVSLGLRLEGQNHIHDAFDPAPRLGISWAPKPVRPGIATVFRGGYGWFSDRFTVPNQIAGNASPYLSQVIRNDGANQQNYIVKSPSFFDPNLPISRTQLTTSGTQATPYRYSLAPHFHAALDMQTTAGIDQALGKHTTASVTYLYTRGIHQYLTNNVTAQTFDVRTYTLSGPAPSEYNYQFQSGGTYKQHQVIVSTNSHAGKVSVQAVYTYNHANSDTQGATYFPSVSTNPSFDYGRATFGITHQFTLQATYLAPWGIEVAPFFAIQSGTPFNITVGSDLTGNNQSNARPTYGTCGAAGVVNTAYGCLDSAPSGKGGKIIPYNLGSGPMNTVLNLSVRRSIGFSSPKNSHGAQPRQLMLIIGATNMLNMVNLGTPNGVLSSPLFGKSQSLATGTFASPSPGNRTVYATGLFSF